MASHARQAMGDISPSIFFSTLQFTGKPRIPQSRDECQKQNTRSATRTWYAPWTKLRYLPAEDAPIPCGGIGALLHP